MAELTTAVRKKSRGRSRLAGGGGAVLGVRPATLDHRDVAQVSKISELDQAYRRGELLDREILVVPDVLALALAQLVRDRWAAERRGHDEDRGRLRVVEKRQDP